MRFYKLVFLLFTILEANNITFLNKAQRNWISHHKSPIVIGITEIPNQILVTKDGYKGFCIDLFKLISKRTNLQFKYKYFNTWSEVLNAAKNKKIDVIFLAQKTPSRLSYLDFTNTVLELQNKIIVNIHKDKFENLKQLKNKRVAVTKGSAIEEYITYNYPDIKLLLTNNELESLRLLNQGKVDASILGSVRASYYIKKYNLNNLLIGSTMDYSYYLSIASRSDETMLNVILDKSVANLKKEIQALELKWGYAKDKVVFFDTKTLIFISIIFIILLFFIIYSNYINRKLSKEIEDKNEALKRIKNMRDSKLNQMSEVISMIAHQWKQPLNTLSLIEEILIMDYKEGKLDENSIMEFDKNFKKQVNLMNQTITDFKNFMKIEEQQEKFDVDEVINHAIYILKEDFNKNKINIEYETQDDSFKVIGYKNALEQIIINILNNAKDALIDNKIENKKIKINITKTDMEILLTIEDNAGGIPIEIIDKIFNPYFSTKKDKNGTGLGLYIAKVIIEENMNGIIDVENKNEGASFIIKLPKVE